MYKHISVAPFKHWLSCAEWTGQVSKWKRRKKRHLEPLWTTQEDLAPLCSQCLLKWAVMFSNKMNEYLFSETIPGVGCFVTCPEVTHTWYPMVIVPFLMEDALFFPCNWLRCSSRKKHLKSFLWRWMWYWFVVQFRQKVKRFKKILTSPPLSPASRNQLRSSASQVKDSPDRMGQSPLLEAGSQPKCQLLELLSDASSTGKCLDSTAMPPPQRLRSWNSHRKGQLTKCNTAWSYLCRTVH